MKFKRHQIIKAKIAQLIIEALEKISQEKSIDLELNLDQIYKLLNPPPKKGMGDLAFPTFLFAKTFKIAPPQVAQLIQESISSDKLISEAKCFGPYLNFFLNLEEKANIVLNSILDQSIFNTSLVSEAPKTIIEFSQPNTHKEMHVGHMRNLCLGDALVKIYKYCGVETLSTTFPGDVGTHVAKCLWYYKKHNTEAPPEIRKGAWLGTLYTKANNLLEEQKGSEYEDTNRMELTQILKELHAGSGEYYDLWKETRQWSVDLMQEVYNWANVSFDSWYWESDVDADSVKLVQEYYDKGLFIKDNGAIGINLEDDKLGFCLLLKSDGTGLYATKDLELARRKFVDQKVERSVYIVDNRQRLHFKQVFKTLEKMGFENAKNCHHLEYEMVELTDGAMSSRKGNIVALQDLIDQMKQTICDNFLNKYDNEWSKEEIETVANQVAAGAIKYGMTRVDSHKKIVFDMKEWLKLDGESGPYIQYVYARIQSLLEKLDSDKSIADYKSLTHSSENALVNHLSEFNAIVQSCLENYKTHTLCAYLYELAKLFNSFYAECSVANAETKELKAARALLCEAVAITLKQGLSLLGIEAPKRM